MPLLSHLLVLFPSSSLSYVLTSVPTILASMLIMYIGLELIPDVLVHSSSSMVWHEWVTVADTTLTVVTSGTSPCGGVEGLL